MPLPLQTCQHQAPAGPRNKPRNPPTWQPRSPRQPRSRPRQLWMMPCCAPSWTSSRAWRRKWTIRGPRPSHRVRPRWKLPALSILTLTVSDPLSQPESGEEASSDDDFEPNDWPLVTFGSAIGSTIWTKVRNKILSNKFVEMHELLSNFHTKSNEFTIRPGKHGAQFVRAQPKLVSFSQWCEGFDVFISIFVEQATSTTSAIKLTKALLTYKKQVNALYKQGYDWAGYDRHFHQEREHQPMSWPKLRADLQLQYAHMPQSNTSRPSNFRPSTPHPAIQPSSTPRVMRTPDGNTILHGHCLSFHSHNERCDRGPQCPYVHKRPQPTGMHWPNASPPPAGNLPKPNLPAPIKPDRLAFHLAAAGYDTATSQYLVQGFT